MLRRPRPTLRPRPRPLPRRRPAARATPPAPAAPPPPKPVPPYVQAAQRRRRIPIWAMPVLALLPLWALIYAQAMRPQEVELTGALAVGEEVYAQCSSCHGEAGQGGVGYPFTEGEVIKTFPNIEDQVSFVSTGSQIFDGQVYGDPNREGGPHIGLARGNGAMPAFGDAAHGGRAPRRGVPRALHPRRRRPDRRGVPRVLRPGRPEVRRGRGGRRLRYRR